MIGRSKSLPGWLAVATAVVTLGSSWWAATGIRDGGASHGIAGEPVDVAVAPDGTRVFVTAPDDESVWIFDAASGQLVSRQSFDARPLELSDRGGVARPIVSFDGATVLCEVHPFRERTLASCFEPGEPDVTDEHEPTPVVIGAVEEPDATVVVALARRDPHHPAIRLRRYAADAGGRRWVSRGGSPWVAVPRAAVHAARSAMVSAPDPRRILVAVPGLGQMMLFGASLALEGDVSVGPDPTDIALDDDGQFAFLADGLDGRVRKLDVLSGSVVADAAVQGDPQHLSFDGERGLVWVAAPHVGEVVALSADSLATVVRVPMREGITAVAVDGPRGRLVAANSRHGTVTSWMLEGGASGEPPTVRLAWEVARR